MEDFGSEGPNAIKVATCESGLNPSTVGDTALEYVQNNQLYGYSSGLFQIRHLPGRPDPITLLDPVVNIKYASEIYKQQGWSIWTCARNLGIK